MKYVAIIEGKDDNFSAFVPDVTGAVGAGSSPEAALESLSESFNFQLNDLTERGISWPEPTPKEHIDMSDFDPDEPYQFAELEPAAAIVLRKQSPVLHLAHKGYRGDCAYSSYDGVFYGRAQGVRALVSYEGSSVEKLQAAFVEAVNDYLELCETTGQTAETA